MARAPALAFTSNLKIERSTCSVICRHERPVRTHDDEEQPLGWVPDCVVLEAYNPLLRTVTHPFNAGNRLCPRPAGREPRLRHQTNHRLPRGFWDVHLSRHRHAISLVAVPSGMSDGNRRDPLPVQQQASKCAFINFLLLPVKLVRSARA